MAPSSANREKTAKACKAMKPFGISAETVKSALERLLEAYENDWTYIEEDNYRVLLDAIFAPEEEAEPLQKEAQLESETEFSPPSGTSGPCATNYASELHQTAESDQPIPQFEIPLAVILPDSPRDFCDDGSWLKRKKSVDLEDEYVDNKENDDENEIEIASSGNGEVKLAFCICKPPEGFCTPSVDEVMKQVEDMYKEKFEGLGTEFSISGILEDICEGFVKEGEVLDD